MDPLSTLASIIAVVQLVEGIIRGLKVFSAFRDAPADVVRLVDELSDLRFVLQQVVDIFGQHAAANAVPGPLKDLLETLIYRTGKNLRTLEELLQQSIFKGGDGKIARFAWLRQADRIKTLRETLRDSKQSLSLLKTSAILYVSRSLFQVYKLSNSQERRFKCLCSVGRHRKGHASTNTHPPAVSRQACSSGLRAAIACQLFANIGLQTCRRTYYFEIVIPHLDFFRKHGKSRPAST